MGILDIINRNSFKKKQSHIKNLIEVALADGVIDNDEIILLLNVAGRMKVTEQQVDEIKANLHAIKFISPSRAKERFHQVYDLVCMMMANGRIDPKELELCKSLALKLGYMPLIVDDFIKIIEKNISGKISAKSIRKSLKVAE